jgi:hypothetical protein
MSLAHSPAGQDNLVAHVKLWICRRFDNASEVDARHSRQFLDDAAVSNGHSIFEVQARVANAYGDIPLRKIRHLKLSEMRRDSTPFLFKHQSVKARNGRFATSDFDPIMTLVPSIPPTS